VTYQEGFRATGTMMIGGRDAVAKARRTAEAIFARVRRMLAAADLADFRRTSVEVLGAEDTYGPHARAGGSREVILKVAVHHDVRDGAELFSREFLPSATSMAQGITGFAGGRPKVTPLIRLFSCLVDKAQVPVTLAIGDGETPVAEPSPRERGEGWVRGASSAQYPSPEASAAADPSPSPCFARVPPSPRKRGEDNCGATCRSLLSPSAADRARYGRSGDKGDDANIGVIARRAEFVPALRAALTAEAVKTYLAHLVAGAVERYELPGINGFNFVLRRALDGGGVASLRHDPQGQGLRPDADGSAGRGAGRMAGAGRSLYGAERLDAS